MLFKPIYNHVFGKIVRKDDFDFRKYDPKVIGFVFFRAALNCFSKTC